MKKNNIIRILITIFIIFIPLLDMLRSTSFKDVEVFGLALIELINISLIGIALLLTLTKVSVKKIIALIIYLIIVGFYVFLHYKNIILFDTNIFAKADFNFIRESFYILRVYVLPLMLLFVLLNNKDIFNKYYYLKMIKYLIIIISFSIIILDVFKLSFISYNDNKHFVLYNIFDYFLYTGDYKQISARGFFDSANELSAILLMLMPINIYLFYKEHKNFNIVLYVSQFVAMILLGTRTAAYGSLLISIVAFICYICLIFMKQERKNKFFEKYFTVSALVCTAFLTISPFMLGRINDGTPDFSVKDISAYKAISKTAVKDVNKLIEKYQSEYMINEYFLKLYPVDKDSEFWLGIIKRDKALNNDSRLMKIDILKRIYERNNNQNDKFYGMGYTLNFLDLERDYYYQYYIFGIFGLLLFICPYFIVLGYLVFRGLLNFKNNFKLTVLLCIMSVCLGLLIAYYSGHVFGWVGPMMILVLMFGILSSMIIYEKEVMVNGKEK